MTIRIPHPSRTRALILVDIQPTFVGSEHGEMIENIKRIIQEGGYDLFIEANFHADENSVWKRQADWTFPVEETLQEITELLPREKTIQIEKTAKSSFHGNKNLVEILKQKNIEEVHLVGLDTNDCVMATAFDAFDNDFWTYVIEEGTGASEGIELHEAAIKILRNVELTNHSELIDEVKEI